MVFFITNGYEDYLIKLIHCFNKQLTVNEQLPLIEKNIKLDMDEYFTYGYQLPFGLVKCKHMFIPPDTDKLFFVLDINKIKERRSYETEFTMFVHMCKKHLKNAKFVFIPSSYLLQNYLNTFINTSSVDLSIVKLIKYFKYNRDITSATRRAITNSNIPSIIIPDIVHEPSPLKFLQLKRFLNINAKTNISITKPLLEHKKIKNWDKIFNGLSNTEFYNYLK